MRKVPGPSPSRRKRPLASDFVRTRPASGSHGNAGSQAFSAPAVTRASATRDPLVPSYTVPAMTLPFASWTFKGFDGAHFETPDRETRLLDAEVQRRRPLERQLESALRVGPGAEGDPILGGDGRATMSAPSTGLPSGPLTVPTRTGVGVGEGVGDGAIAGFAGAGLLAGVDWKPARSSADARRPRNRRMVGTATTPAAVPANRQRKTCSWRSTEGAGGCKVASGWTKGFPFGGIARERHGRFRRSCLIVLAVASQVAAAEMAPADVAKHFYQLANQRKCDEASKLFTSDSLKVIKGTLGGKASFAEFCAEKGGKSALASLETRVEAYRGRAGYGCDDADLRGWEHGTRQRLPREGRRVLEDRPWGEPEPGEVGPRLPREGSMHRLPILVVLTSSLACASVPPRMAQQASPPRTGQVSYRLIQDPAGQPPSDAAESHQELVPPTANPQNMPPPYPHEGMEQACQDTTVVVRLIINAQGNVAEIRDSPFGGSVLSACLHSSEGPRKPPWALGPSRRPSDRRKPGGRRRPLRSAPMGERDHSLVCGLRLQVPDRRGEGRGHRSKVGELAEKSLG